MTCTHRWRLVDWRRLIVNCLDCQQRDYLERLPRERVRAAIPPSLSPLANHLQPDPIVYPDVDWGVA